MRVLLLSRYDRLGASSRIRSYQYLPILQDHGIEVEVSPLLSNDYLRRSYSRERTNWIEIVRAYFSRALMLCRLGRFDLVWIEKELFPNLPAWFERALRAVGVRYVVDYDDAIFHAYEFSRNPVKRLLAHKIDMVMKSAALVICGNEYLAGRARAAGARWTEIVPTAIDLRKYKVRMPLEPRAIVIGWIGTPYTVKYLQLVVAALRALASEVPVKLCVIGAKLEVAGLDVECRSWSEDSEVADLAQLTIGIMPLWDSPWERGKCGYKLIQYMGCGLPVVASPVGGNVEIVQHGVNGYLALTAESWYWALRALCIDADKRQSMGGSGRQCVERRFCIQVTGPRLAELFRQAVA